MNATQANRFLRSIESSYVWECEAYEVEHMKATLVQYEINDTPVLVGIFKHKQVDSVSIDVWLLQDTKTEDETDPEKLNSLIQRIRERDND